MRVQSFRTIAQNFTGKDATTRIIFFTKENTKALLRLVFQIRKLKIYAKKLI